MNEIQTGVFVKPLTIKELEQRYGNAWKPLFSFLEGSCCIDTEPPLPPGTSK